MAGAVAARPVSDGAVVVAAIADDTVVEVVVEANVVRGGSHVRGGDYRCCWNCTVSKTLIQTSTPLGSVRNPVPPRPWTGRKGSRYLDRC